MEYLPMMLAVLVVGGLVGGALAFMFLQEFALTEVVAKTEMVGRCPKCKAEVAFSDLKVLA